MERHFVQDAHGQPDLFEGEVEIGRRETLPKGEARYARLSRIVTNRAFATFRVGNGSLLVDMQTANLLVSLSDKLNEKNREKFLSMDLRQMVSVAWKLALGV